MKWTWILGLLLGAPTLYAQSSGLVRDMVTKEVIVGCVVYNEVGTRSTITDQVGVFTWPEEETMLVFKALGYRNDTIFWNGSESERVVELSSDVMNEVQIVENRGATELSLLNPQGFQTLGIKELCKAACCNLSESFETNASIDAAFTDAITGTKQIRMLGLDGKYTQIMFDNLPGVRGLASTYGLTYVPGPFIYQIQIAKGAGSVTAGYESIAGQINVAHKSPDNAERLFINGYMGSGGRTELNVVLNPKFNQSARNWTTSLMAHGAYSQLRRDMNGDGFLDNPLFSNLIVRNEWRWKSSRGWGGQYTASYMQLKNVSGQFDFDPVDEIRAKLWGVDLGTKRYEFSAKTGYVFQGKEWKSFGSQVTLLNHTQDGTFGFRRYDGRQLSARVNLLFASRIGTDKHKYVVGITWSNEDYNERISFDEFPPVVLSSLAQSRREQVLGSFAEYTWNPNEKWVVVTGARMDYHNMYGAFVTPRLHARWSLTDKSSLKFMTGQGRRVANILMDNVGMLAGNRDFVGPNNQPLNLNKMDMEVAWNSGVIWSQKLKIAHRDANFSVDAYRTNFQQQVVIDFETAEQVRIYNLDGKSYSHSFQIEAQYAPIRRLDVRMAYRWLEVKTQYLSGLLDKPLLNKHRAFVNLAYETKSTAKGSKWMADITAQWISSKRLPSTHGNHNDMVPMSQYSEDYYQVNLQLTRVFSPKMEVYAGCENMTNFMVHQPIVSAENPQDQSFDSSLIWGPVFGRMYYFGFRWNLFPVNN